MKHQYSKSPPASCEAISHQLDLVLASPEFNASPQQIALLKYVVSQVLAGNADQVKGYTAATEVFGRKADFDQSIDPIVSIPEMYPVIGECLLAAMKDVLGDAATPEVLEAWEEAYGALAEILINREREIYQELDSALFPVKA